MHLWWESEAVPIAPASGTARGFGFKPGWKRSQVELKVAQLEDRHSLQRQEERNKAV